MDEEGIERNKKTTVEKQFIESKALHEQMAELCELYAQRADQHSESPQSASPLASRGKTRSA